MDAPRDETLHASAVEISGRAVLILGPSGSGKSALALDLMSRGASLIADDRTVVSRVADVPVASAPDGIRGRIEARGIGILASAVSGPTPVLLVVDLGQAPDGRLPQRHIFPLVGVEIQLINARGIANVGPAILQYLKGGRVD